MAAPTPIYYFDISNIGKDLTGKRDVPLLTNEQALLESVKNIIITEPGERVMNPLFGCGLSKFLFEPIDPVTITSLETVIRNSINNFEDRIENLVINIKEKEDLNTIEIELFFNMKTYNNTLTLTLDLNRIR